MTERRLICQECGALLVARGIFSSLELQCHVLVVGDDGIVDWCDGPVTDRVGEIPEPARALSSGRLAP